MQLIFRLWSNVD